MKNQEIAQILSHIAGLLEMQGVPFKPRAYQKAARTVESLAEDIAEVWKRGGLEELPGIGASITEKIGELLKTGRLRYYEQLKKQMPMDVDALLGVPGLGPKRIKLLYDKLRIRNLAELGKAAQGHKIRELEGFGAKVEEDILKGIAIAQQRGKRFLLGSIMPAAEELRSRLAALHSVADVEIAGSYRRRQESIGDLDILVTSAKPQEVMDFFVKMPEVAEVLAHGATKSAVRLHSGLQVDVRVLKERDYGSALQYFTGSKEHNVALRTLALSKGYTLSEYGLFALKGKKWVAGRTEEEIYRKLGLQRMEPELRNNTGELEAAAKGKLPKLIAYGQVAGDFQTQTEWSDGSDSIEALARYAQQLGLKFVAITDHVGQLAITHALDEKRLLKQMQEIDKLSRKLDIRIFKGAEVDILKNGRLALSRKLQKQLDVVLGSVHLATKMTEQEMTKRICSALENDQVHILAHPTGRLIQRREPYAVNLEKLFDCAKRTGTFLEINGQPERLDLKDVHIRAAKEAGCRFAISTDAHAKSQLQYLELGVAMARRGWLEAKDVLNTLKVKEIEKVLRQK